MIQTLILLAALAIIPHTQYPPPKSDDPHHNPFDYSLERFHFFRDQRPDGPLPSTHRLIFYRHHYYDAKGTRIEQLVPIYNNSHFYWHPEYVANYVRIHVVKMHGRYEIEKITTWSMKPIKPNSLRKPDNDEDNDDCQEIH